ncbi:hypothetical protein [Cerasicoccus maritimus]|uniref:hypothetical protein n=1 Tax=Cerasicoccus maritimus TaxID=490089 RepID=UPI0028524D1A|nr:hypothetical protein [Cerasicoccus maritimus]
MKTFFTNNQKYENKKMHQAFHNRRKPERRRRLGHALGYFNGDGPLAFYLNLIFR